MPLIATFNRADPGPYDRDVELLRSGPLFILRYAGGQPWINPAVPREAPQHERCAWPSEESARAYIDRVFKNFAPRVEKSNQKG